jgi:hypothetical protein
MKASLSALSDFNTAVTSGPPDTVDRWKKAGGARILPATYFDAKGQVRQNYENGSRAGVLLRSLRSEISTMVFR